MHFRYSWFGFVSCRFQRMFHSAQAGGRHNWGSYQGSTTTITTSPPLGHVTSLLLLKPNIILSGALGIFPIIAAIQSPRKISHRSFLTLGKSSAHLLWHCRMKYRGRKPRGTGSVVLTTPNPKYHNICLCWAPCCVIDSKWLVSLWVPSIRRQACRGSVWACLSGYFFLLLFFLLSGGNSKGAHIFPICFSTSYSIDVSSEQWSCRSQLSLWHQSASLRKRCIIQ